MEMSYLIYIAFSTFSAVTSLTSNLSLAHRATLKLIISPLCYLLSSVGLTTHDFLVYAQSRRIWDLAAPV
ncbi:hypothetical protein IW262DRAFT_1372779 [Armillaria fumosa]|nr:hypothetical protein IW262DRAFT_1372779 [Armillaria fumosa]